MATDSPGKPVDQLPEETVGELLAVIAPGSVLLRVDPLPGSFSNDTHAVEARSADGSDFRVVVRRYAVFGDYDRGAKARREYQTLQLLRDRGVPMPKPLYLDDSGELLGTPGIVTGFVAGEMVLSPLPDAAARARSLATTLARIHSVPCGAAHHNFLLDANAEVTWFLQSGNMPEWMKAHADGPTVWHAVRALKDEMESVAPGLVHVDYWPGNVLWQGHEVAAVVDWEEAAYGDPAIDVAYCRMDMFLSGTPDAAEEFLRAYESRRGSVPNLSLFELAAAARPMFSPQGWITASPAKENFRHFVANAITRAS